MIDLKKENAKRIAKTMTAFAAAAAMAAVFTFPAEIGDGLFEGFGNAYYKPIAKAYIIPKMVRCTPQRVAEANSFVQ